ncbi:hypothetical protein RJ641_021622 [Dillenia turbinata]|uniref:F-box domain-containing protein n=1 Tax=Dillenia turbinata TaxID=194707 RepID=A0AAN8UM30_9MAGN
MEQRKWEELKVDCLVNVFRRLGMETLLLDIPFVCKSWYLASKNPLCWESIIFPNLIPDIRNAAPFRDKLIDRYQLKDFSTTAFIKFVIGRSQRCVTLLELPSCCTEEALVFVANECPALRSLALPSALLLKQSALIPKLICKWKNLEVLRLEGILDMSSILPEISHHCNNFVELSAVGAFVGKGQASAIVTFLPNIKRLVLRKAAIEHDCLKTILEGCNELVLLDVRDCIGFKETDEILNLAAHVEVFISEGSRTRI